MEATRPKSKKSKNRKKKNNLSVQSSQECDPSQPELQEEVEEDVGAFQNAGEAISDAEDNIDRGIIGDDLNVNPAPGNITLDSLSNNGFVETSSEANLSDHGEVFEDTFETTVADSECEEPTTSYNNAEPEVTEHAEPLSPDETQPISATDDIESENDFAMNNLSIITKESELLRRSRLNVIGTPAVSPTENPQSDQLYPSLNDEYFQGLEDKSSVLNRSVSQTSCYSHDDMDNLSMKCAEERLNHIPNYFQESDIEQDADLRSFEVVMYDENNEICDLDATMENTVHHSSLRAGLNKDVTEDTFHNYFDASHVTPAPSVSNFHELNRVILIDELRAYYYNPQLIQNEDFLKDFFSICVNKTHEFHLLIMSYSTARNKLLEFEKVLDGYINKYKKHESNVWSFPKDKIEKSAYCADHVKVSHIETFIKAQCNQEILKEVKESLDKISDNCSEPLVLLQYNWKIAFYHVEQYIVNVAQNCGPLYHMTGEVTAFIPGVIPWEHVNQTSNLRVCISILYYFKRQKCNDEVFSKDIDRWLCTLVSMLLRVSTLLDHRFLLNHLLRCPTGFSFWGTSYLQFVMDNTVYNCETIVGNPIIDHIILMYKTLIEPIRERDNLLVEYEAPKQPSESSEWMLIDEIGEVDCDDKQLLERDYLQMLNQFNFGMLYREILRYQTVDEFIANKYTVNENEVMTLFSICLQCIGFIKEAFLHLDFTRYRKFCQMNAKILTTLIKFSSDYYHFYERFGGKYEKYIPDDDELENKLLTLHDYVFQEGFKCLAETSNVSLWQFLADLPYHRVSLKILWRLYAFLHQINPEKTLKDADIEVGYPYDIVIKLYKTARFQRRLDGLSDEDSTFMVNVFCKMALSRNIEDGNFIKIIGLDIYHIGVTASQEKQSTDHACKNCLSSIIQHCPSVVSALIESIEKPTLKDLPQNLKIFKGISLIHWLPSDNDFIILASWLQSTSISSLTNQLSRIIIKGLNWNSHENKLFIPVEVHRRWAVIIVAAHSYHLPDRPGYLINSPAQDFVKHVSNSDKNIFVHWCWEVLLSLCLNKSDVAEYDGARRRIARRMSRDRVAQRRKSDTTISTRQLVLLPRQMSSNVLGRQRDPESEEQPHSAFVGKWGKFPYKIIKEESLASMCEALRTSGEMAAFVALSITTLGHSMIDFQADGIPLLVVLQKASQYRAMLNIISNLLSIVLKNKCVHLLINLPDFLPTVLMLTRAECCSAFSGRSGRPLTGLVVSKLVEGYLQGDTEGNLVLKFWIQLFFSIQGFHTETSVVTLLDRMFRVVFRYGGDCQFILDSLYIQLEKHLDHTKRNQNKLTTLVSWISGSTFSPTLLTGVTSTGEVFWWSYHVLLMECQGEKTSNFFHTLTEVLLTNPEISMDHAVRRTHTLVTTEATASLTPANLAIYRWGELLSKVPVDHPLLPFAWREFFKLYFHRPAQGTGGVGYRFYQGAFQQRDLRFMKQRLLDSAKNYERDLDDIPSEETPETILSSKLSHFFTSLSLWSEETRLHEANLYVPSLPLSYNGEKLDDLLEQRDCLWLDLIDYNTLDQQIESDRKEWIRYKERSYKPKSWSVVDDSAETLADLLYSYIRKNSSESEPPPPLVIPQSHIPITPDLELEQLDGQAIIGILGPYFGKLKASAEEFVDISSKMCVLNTTFIEDLPYKYTNKTVQNTQFVSCYNRMNPITHRCNGPASILITSTQYHDNPTVIEAVDVNREEFKSILSVCKEELCDDICITAMFVEKLVSDLYRSHSSCQALGRKLFYHVVDNLCYSVWRYPPSQQIFSFSIDCLGQYFIRSAPEETMELLAKILLHNNFATVLAPLFHPNPGYEQFLKLYAHVINSMGQCKPDVAFMVLSKFDIRSWLTTLHSNIVGSKELLNSIFLGFDVYGKSEDNNYLMFYDTLKIHLRMVLRNRLSALTQYTIDKTLEICVQTEHHQEIWKEIVDIINSDYGRQSLTLQACHRVLYELAKYFLQFRKSILKSIPNDLYSPWMPYVDSLINLFSALCHLYIEKASFLGVQQSRPSHPLKKEIAVFSIENVRNRKAVPSEEYNYHIFNMVCTLFGPWILVFEEQCLPWCPEGAEAAGSMLSLFCDLLTVMETEIAFEGGEPLLNMFWEYYYNTLGHPIVPSDIINVYYHHLIKLPWEKFVPNLDILTTLVLTVKKNRLTANFVVAILTMVDWQECVAQLQKEPATFDTLLNLLITFSLNNDIFFRFSKDFVNLFNKFKMLDLSLVSDEGFLLFMKRIDSTVQRNQLVQSISNTGHLLTFMGTLCRFKQTGASYNKQLSYFTWVVQIMNKICSPQYIEILINSLLYSIEHVFYISGTEDHIVALCSELLTVFNMNIADPKTGDIIIRRINVQLKDKVSVKSGFSFSQLSLYFLTSITTSITNVKVQAILCEIVSESYFLHCEFTYPVLSVSWSTLDERFLLPDMNNEIFINHSVNEGTLLNLYLYTHHLLAQAENMDQEYFAVTTLIDCVSRVVPLVGEEQKVLLLWFKIFDILIDLKNNGIRSSVLHSSIRPLPATMLKLSEDREATGLFGTLGFGKKSKYSIEFRLSTKIIAAYILHQMNKDGSLRVEGATRHNLTTEANKAMDNVRSLLSNKAYAAHITQIQHCIGTILDTSCTFLHTREIIRYLVQHCYGDKPYLAVIYYHNQRTASASRGAV